MNVYHCWDGEVGSHPEEQCHMLFVAEGPENALDMWRDMFGRDVWPDQYVEVAEWLWPDIEPPRLPEHPCAYWPAERTEFGPAYLGYGIWLEDDVECEQCGEHVAPEDIHDVEDGLVCTWCIVAVGP